MKKTFYLILICVTLSIQITAQCWQKITTGFGHTLAIKTNGTLWAWGLNNAGQLGDGTNNPNSIVPIQIGTATNWQFISVGAEHSLAIKTDGTLWAWGRNSEAQLGDGTNNNSNVPIQIGIDNNWVAVSAGSEHNLAKKSNGTLWAWGGNTYGQCGNATPPNSVATPQQVGTATNWQNISAVSYHSLAIQSDGTLWAWGLNLNGQLGDGTYINRDVPVAIGFETDWKLISTGWNHSIAIKTDGTLWAWGDNNFGQLGDGTNTYQNQPIAIGTATNWQSITTGEGHSMAIKTDGTLWAWGRNHLGQLGNGANTNINVPTQTGTATNWSGIDAGYYFTLGVKTDNTLWAWGNNNAGQLGDGTNTDRNTPIQISCGTLLPVTWLYVNGAWQNNTALIRWATASESNTSSFEIEYSSNGISFSNIGTIAAAGNSSGTIHYKFLHNAPTIGTNYYRIKQIDLDGKFIYSSIIAIQNTGSQARIIITPNPVQKEVSLFFSNTSTKKIQLLNMSGNILLTEKINGANSTHRLNMSNFIPGIYILRIQIENGIETHKIIKQ